MTTQSARKKLTGTVLTGKVAARVESRAIFPGSFDPLTCGHSDIVRRSASLFGHIVVAVLSNPEKKLLFSEEERVRLIQEELKDLGQRVSVKSFSGLLVDFARSESCSVIVRGLRAVSDYDYEAQMALMNKRLCDDIETVFLVTREENSYVSSSLVKQVALMGGDVSQFVSPNVLKALRRRLRG